MIDLGVARHDKIVAFQISNEIKFIYDREQQKVRPK